MVVILDIFKFDLLIDGQFWNGKLGSSLFFFSSGSSLPQEVPEDSFEDDRNLIDAVAFEKAADDDEDS